MVEMLIYIIFYIRIMYMKQLHMYVPTLVYNLCTFHFLFRIQFVTSSTPANVDYVQVVLSLSLSRLY